MTKQSLTENIIIDTEYASSKEAKGAVASPVRMGKLILHDLNVAKDAAGNLYYYDGGVYKGRGEIAVGEMYRRQLILRDEEYEWTSRKREEITKYIVETAPYLLEVPNLYRINMLNGIFDWRVPELLPPDPGYRTTVQIPITYNPDASCPYWDQFLTDIFPEGINLLKEIIALCMIPFMDLQKCIVLVGEGSNGKSAYLNGLRRAVGNSNICSVSLHKLTSNQERFYTAGLVNKLVNVFADLSAKDIQDTANFKALTGEDTVTIEYKGKQPFDYLSFCRMIFSCNKIVKSEDDTTLGYQRRFLNIPFVRKFTLDPSKGQEIKENLSDPFELSGLFNSLVPLFYSLTETGFTWTTEIAAMVDNYCPIPDGYRSWLVTNIIEDPNGWIPSSAFYDYFTQNCQHVEAFQRGKLVTYIKNIFPSCKANHTTRVWSGEPPIKCYRGIRLVNQTMQIAVVELAWKTRQSEVEVA